MKLIKKVVDKSKELVDPDVIVVNGDFAAHFSQGIPGESQEIID